MIVKIMADGGEMKAGPAIAQQLGPMGINLGKLIEDVNKATAGFKGMKVPVEVDVNKANKSYTIHVSSPPVAELLKKELRLEKGSGAAGSTKVGNLAIEQVISIANTKHPNMLARDLKAAVKLVLGSCVSLGILVENKEAKEVETDVESGMYEKEIRSIKTEVSQEKRKQLDSVFNAVKTRQEAAAKALAEAKAAEEAAKAAAATAPAAGAAPAPAAGAAPAKAEAKPAAKDAKKK